MVIMIDCSVYLTRINLSDNNVDSCMIKREGKLDSNQIDVCQQVFHCNGSILCISRDKTKLVVFNPYWGQTRWIESTRNLDRPGIFYLYALGYDKSSSSHKVLRFRDYFSSFVSDEFKIYDFNSDSWKVLDVTPEWRVEFYRRGVTLKGNTYWIAFDKYLEAREEVKESFLVCFDFTRERFGPCLPLPFDAIFEDTVSLSIVRGEQLVVLFQPWYTSMKMESWVTRKIEPDAVSWQSKVFLEMSLRELIHPQLRLAVTSESFFIDEEKKVAVVFDEDTLDETKPPRNAAYIIGVDRSFKKVDLGEGESAHRYCYPLVCSYVPSLVQFNN